MEEKNWWEILRIAGITLLMLFAIGGEYLLFANGFIQVHTINYQRWADNNFKPAAVITFIFSMILVLSWYGIVLKAINRYDAKKHFWGYRITWCFFLIISLFVAGIMSYLYCFTSSPISVLWFGGFLLANTIVTYWTTTAISTPNLIRHTVPFGGYLNHK